MISSGSLRAATVPRIHGVRFMAAAGVALALTGCASTVRNPQDPLEPINRQVHRFNEHVDAAVLRPAATAYERAVPSILRSGVSNFFGNLSDGWSMVNHVLQLRWQPAAETFARVNLNTFFGLGGLIDVGSELDVDRHPQDFGQTLGRYGVPTGPYLVLPLLGPSTVRDAGAMVVDRRYELLREVGPPGDRDLLYVLQAVDARAKLLRLDGLLDQVALDRYGFIRDAYLQRRRGGEAGEQDVERHD